ncbi:MAG: oligosaccharide flippase family protein [Bacteroidaceae bacterium]|nr:oligosaccharide flippase family protein [Bacteroidaceae bacterium]
MEQEKKRTKNTETTFGHVLRYTGVFGSVQGLKTLVSMARNKLTVVLLGSTGFGLISVYNTISEFLVSCSNFGLPLNATRETSELYEADSSERVARLVCVIRTWALWTALFSALVCILLSPFLSYYFFDNDYRRYPEVMLVIPIVCALLIAEAECAVLKGLRRLKRVAIIESVSAFTTLLLTVPFYFLWGMHGVIIGLIVSTVAACIVHLSISVRVVPYRVQPFSRQVFVEGLPMIRRGLPYVIAAIANAGAAMVVVGIIKHQGMLANVGYYRAGFAIITAYAGFVFTALESDYFPRLSSVNHDVLRFNRTINQQIEVSVMLVTPFLILLLAAMPLVVLVLFKPEFFTMLGMMFCAAYYVFLRAIMLPVSYLSLAKGDTLVFLAMEIASDVVFVSSMWYFYSRFGLLGAGISLSLTALYDLVVSVWLFGRIYGCQLSRSVWLQSLAQFACLSMAVLGCFASVGWTKYLLVVPAFLLSSACSLAVLRRKTMKPEH